jgi:hypothetical protein
VRDEPPLDRGVQRRTQDGVHPDDARRSERLGLPPPVRPGNVAQLPQQVVVRSLGGVGPAECAHRRVQPFDVRGP